MKQNKNRELILSIKPTQAEQDLAEIKAIAATPIPVNQVSESFEVTVQHLRDTDPNREAERAADGLTLEESKRLGQIALNPSQRSTEQAAHEAVAQAKMDAFMQGGNR